MDGFLREFKIRVPDVDLVLRKNSIEMWQLRANWHNSGCFVPPEVQDPLNLSPNQYRLANMEGVYNE